MPKGIIAPKSKSAIDPTSVSSYAHYEAMSILQVMVEMLKYSYERRYSTLNIALYQLVNLLLLEIDDRLTIYYNKLKSKSYSKEEKAQISREQEELSYLHDTLVLLNLMEKEHKIEASRIQSLPPIPYDLAVKVKEIWGWIYPVENVTNDETDISNTKEFEQTKHEERQGSVREKTLQKALSSIRYELTPLPKELAKKVKDTWGWDYPTTDDT